MPCADSENTAEVADLNSSTNDLEMAKLIPIKKFF